MNITDSFLQFALATGASWVMVLLLACSVLSVGLILDRVFFFFKNRSDFASFMTELSKRLAHHEPLNQTAAWCSGQKSLEAGVAAIGLERGQENIEAAHQSMQAALLGAKSQYERGLIILGTLGNNTPFIGLFGTIIGIIQAFHVLSTSQEAGSALVMASIAEALVATALGIFVAIPSVVAYNLLQRSLRKRLASADATSRLILAHLESRKEKPSAFEGKSDV